MTPKPFVIYENNSRYYVEIMNAQGRYEVVGIFLFKKQVKEYIDGLKKEIDEEWQQIDARFTR